MYAAYEESNEYQQTVHRLDGDNVKLCTNKRPVIDDEERKERNQQSLKVIYDILTKYGFA